MTKEALAALLEGNKKGKEITKFLETVAKEEGLLIAFVNPDSEDVLRLRGAIDDEINIEVGSIVFFTDERIVYKKKHAKACVKVMYKPAVLPCVWLLTTDAECKTFDILEDGEIFCRGLVIDIKTVKNKNYEESL